MHRNHNISIAQRYLSKNKKYYSARTVQKDKENIISNDINQIIEKLTMQQRLPKVAVMHTRKKSPLSIVQTVTNRKSLQKSKFGVNSMHFFQQDQQTMMNKKDLKKQIKYYMNKMRQPLRSKCSLYQQYLALSQQTNDYLEYYLINFTGQDPGKATQLLKQQGKTIILLILRKKYRCFESNQPDITNRIFLAFNLNPLNDFQFISWQKFMKIKKLISGDFNRKDCTDFLVSYFFIEPKKLLKGSQFWLIFSSVIRKLNAVLDCSHLQHLLQKVKLNLFALIPQNQGISQQNFYKLILQQPLFIWHQFVSLAFL